MNERNPHQLAEARIALSEEYSRYCGEYANLIRKQAEHFKLKRDTFKSDKATEKDFDLTDDGVKMTIIKLKLKSIEKTMSAYGTYLRLKENEAKNLY
jgi:hypothetical protein